MGSIIEAIGVLSGVLGIIQFFKVNFPPPEIVGSMVRVGVGLDIKGGIQNAGGDLPDVRLWNEDGVFLGLTVDPGKVANGGFGDIKIAHEHNLNQQATYALFSANNDAICIAYTTITWPDGDKYAWIGNWGHSCGGTWYYSNVYISSGSQKPDCFWIDGDNNQPQTGFQVHWPDFVKSENETLPSGDGAAQAAIDHICNSTIFSMHIYPDKDPRSIIYTVPSTGGHDTEKTAYGPSKEAESARFQPQQGEGQRRNRPIGGEAFTARVRQTLVIGNSTQHTAEGLCESDTSFGPDFLNVQDGTFCRMSDKTMFSACSDKVKDNCFDVSAKRLVVDGVAAKEVAYGNVIDWTAE